MMITEKFFCVSNILIDLSLHHFYRFKLLLRSLKMIKLDLYLFSVGITTVIQQIALDQHPVLIGYRWLKPDITDSVVPDSINPHTIQINSVRWKKFIP